MVVGLLAIGASLAIKMYRWLGRLPGGNGDAVINSVKVQAGVIATMAGAVFSIIEALVKAKIVLGSTTAPAMPTGQFGYNSGGLAGQAVATRLA